MMADQIMPKPVVFISSADFRVERVFPIRNLVGSSSLIPEADTQVPGAKLNEKGSTVDESASTSGYAGEIQTAGDVGEQDHQGASTADHVVVAAAGQSDGAETAGSSGDKQSQLDADVSTYLPPPYPKIPPESSIRKLTSKLSSSSLSGTRTTERTQFIPSSTGPPGVLPGLISSNAPKTFHKCEDEPIHTPGAIQQHGVLVALRRNETGHLMVRIASENSKQFLSLEPDQLFQLESFLDIFDEVSREDITIRVDNALRNAEEDPKPAADTYLEVFDLNVILPDGHLKHLWCAVHISKGTKDLVICEFETYSDAFYAKSTQMTLPDTPAKTIDIEPIETIKSTTSNSQPLRALEMMTRRKPQSGHSSMDFFNVMTQAQQQLTGTKAVQQALEVVVGLISELTGFHRVMFYRFDSKKNGCVDAELVDPLASADIFRGLNFPASDIPAQARELYKINRIRVLHDRDAETARLVCRTAADFAVPLDLSHSYLRALSPIHLKYLGNMGVRSSMSISVVINNDLWGLIACHGYGDAGIPITLPQRELARNIGECAATNIQRLLMLERIEARKAPKSVSPAQNPSTFIAASSSDLLRVFNADFGLLSVQNEARAIGRLDPYREALAILAHLQMQEFTTVYSTQNVMEAFPAIKYPIRDIAGILIIPLSVGAKDFLVFFKKGQLQEVRWAGNPYEKFLRPNSEYLEPRMSFSRWSETVIGMSKEWTEDNLETALVLGFLYGRFIQIWREKESTGQNNKMKRLLIQNSSHEVRTPLNAIINYLEIALETPLEDQTREILDKAHEASKSLIYVLDDLLNLTKAQDASQLRFSSQTNFDLIATVSEVITAFRKEAMRKDMDLTFLMHPGIPERVRGEASRLRQVISNIISNAFQHSLAGGVKIEMRQVHTNLKECVIEITVQDAGIGMPESQLDDLFQEFEQVVDEDVRFMSGSTTPSSSDAGGLGGSLGVGLAVVARYVRNMGGQIRVQSEPGKGTIVALELTFEHAKATPDARPSSRRQSIMELPLRRGLSDMSLTGYTHERQQSIDQKTSMYLAINSPTSIFTPSSDVLPNVFESPDSDRYGISSSSTMDSSSSNYPFPQMDGATTSPTRPHLSILVAEDNPINSRILTRRLQKLGHEVEVAFDGQECYDYFKVQPQRVDVILMDIQMPLVDGVASTKLIRLHEKSDDELRHARHRVPVIAVSASLKEDLRYDYIQSGFDAWILKPVDFARLDFLLRGVGDEMVRREALYRPGKWEIGGWFIS